MVAFFAQSVTPAAALFGSTRLHDPSVIRVGTCYYGFSTSFNGVNGTTGPSGPWIYKTCDPTLVTGWTYVGVVFNTVPAWVTAALGSTPPNLWAPDINYWNGTYYLYYAGAVWGGSATPVIGLATATNIEGPWTDAGQVVGPTDIDPNMIVASDGTRYLLWGGFGSGTHLNVIDPATGKISTTNTTTWHVANGFENSAMTYNGGYYYLWGSKGTCLRGRQQHLLYGYWSLRQHHRPLP